MYDTNWNKIWVSEWEKCDWSSQGIFPVSYVEEHNWYGTWRKKHGQYDEDAKFDSVSQPFAHGANYAEEEK